MVIQSVINKPDQLIAITNRILQNLKNIQGAPSVQMHPVPPDFVIKHSKLSEIEDNNPDKKLLNYNNDGGIKPDHESEYYENNQDNDRGDIVNKKKSLKSKYL